MLRNRNSDPNMFARNEQDDLRDLGFGSRVSQESRERLINRDGSFNVERTGLSFWQSLNLYHALLTMSWTRFYAALIVGYIAINALFAGALMFCGDDALAGSDGTAMHGYLDAFFFSIQTFTTVGYGSLSPGNLAANIVAATNAFVGLTGFALATGLLFARFSRPTARIISSSRGVIAPYRGIKGFMFRIANRRRSQIIDIEVKVMLTKLVDRNGTLRREYHLLDLERDKVALFPLHWTVVHPIDDTSPLWGVTEEEFHKAQTEFLILLSAVDDTLSQHVHWRSSYRHDEVIWNAKFRDPFHVRPDGSIFTDLRMMHEIEEVVEEGAD